MPILTKENVYLERQSFLFILYYLINCNEIDYKNFLVDKKYPLLFLLSLFEI